MRRDILYTQQGGQLLAERESKQLPRGVTVESVTLNAVDMREYQIDGFLREIVKGDALRDNVPQESMIFLHARLLRGLRRVAEKQVGFLIAVQVVLESRDVGELAAIIRKEYREELSEGQSQILKTLFYRDDC